MRWVITLLVGGVPGALAALIFPLGDEVEEGKIVAIIAAGNVGSDFIEGLFKDRNFIELSSSFSMLCLAHDEARTQGGFDPLARFFRNSDDREKPSYQLAVEPC